MVWLREAVGWVLLGVGLAAFAVCYFVFLLRQRVIEFGLLAFVGFVVFRGGLHLLKVAIASRAVREPLAKPTPPAGPAVARMPGTGPAGS